MADLSRKRPARWLVNSMQSSELPASTTVSEAGVTFGRDAGNTIPIPAERFPGVSGKHARLEVVDDELWLEDLGSSNGTQVAGRAIQRERLEHGAVFELGAGGPRFVVVSSEKLDKTVAMPRPPEVEQATKQKLGDDTMYLVREKLGIHEQMGVGEMVASRSRRTRSMIGVLAFLLVASLVGGWWILKQNERESQDALARIQEENEYLRGQLAEHRAEVDAQRVDWEARGREFDDAKVVWETEKSSLEEESLRLHELLGKLEADERATSGELELLRARLEETNSTLELYNPLNLEQQKLREVARVERCTVLIEADQVFRDEDTGQVLFVDDEGPFGPTVNFEGKGEELKLEATGSGFVLTQDGWVVTNAHVVHKKHEEEPFSIGPDIKLVPEVELRVVFSGDSRRHPATLVKVAADDREDLALLKIEPFEDMPFLEAPELDAPPPARGTEVFLIGFPLGKRVFHEGDTMLASTFKGVLSRVLDDYLQVDAAVHPGASGGPLIDGSGKVIGIVVGMQTVDENASSSAIGYIIPVAHLEKLWPPPPLGE